jgi:hypothetical protein
VGLELELGLGLELGLELGLGVGVGDSLTEGEGAGVGSGLESPVSAATPPASRVAMSTALSAAAEMAALRRRTLPMNLLSSPLMDPCQVIVVNGRTKCQMSSFSGLERPLLLGQRKESVRNGPTRPFAETRSSIWVSDH